MTRRPRNLAASTRERLFRQARVRGEDFQLTLQRYAVERLLFRIAESPYRNRFILKGAMLYAVWGEEAYRPTRDLDLLGQGNSQLESIAECFRAICSLEVEADGILFFAESVRAEEIRETGAYGGVRVRLAARLGGARIRLPVDIGFGDAIVPAPVEIEFPTLLDRPPPRIRACPRETVVAEKLHAAALFGDANTRMKDLYDLFTLPRLFPFDGQTLNSAIAATFARREMPLPDSLPLRAVFFNDEVRAGQWGAFLHRTGLITAPEDFVDVGKSLLRFLAQPYGALVRGVEFRSAWLPGGPWRSLS